jgi:hypothetical protein
MLMVMYMMASGKMTKHTEWAIICTPTEPPIMESGKMINNTAKVLRLGQTEHDMRALILKERSMGRELFVSQMAVCILETFSSMRSQEGANMFGLMVNHTKVNGRKIKCTGMAF